MKNIYKILFITICLMFTSANNSYASTLKNFYAYQVKDVNIRELGAKTRAAVDAYQSQDKFKPLEAVQNTYIYTGEKNNSYFVRFYPANQNTDVFVVSNEKYDVKNNDLTQLLDVFGYKYEKLTDKEAIKEYKFDFYALARKHKLGSFYISPDLVKPLKTGMAKLNNKMAKNNKKTSVLPYSVDSEPIKLTCVDTISEYDEQSKFAILRKEYRLKQKSNKYVHAYEYVLTNRNNSTAKVSATSERLAGLKDVTTEAFVDLDRLDLIDTVGSFPPVVICTCGTSLLCSIPNWIRLARITKEASRYAHSLPENYQVNANGQMRVLVLKYKNNPKPVNFDITVNNQNYKLSF